MDFLMNLGEGSQFAIQLAIVLICLFYGAKKGGIALGMLGGVGLIVLVFGFGIELAAIGRSGRISFLIAIS